MVIRHKHSHIKLLSSGLMGTSRAAYAEKYGRLVNHPLQQTSSAYIWHADI